MLLCAHVPCSSVLARRAVRDEQRTVLGICRSRATYDLQLCVGYGVHRRAITHTQHRVWRVGVGRPLCLPATYPSSSRRPLGVRNKDASVQILELLASALIASPGRQATDVLLQTFQHLCSRSRLPTVHTGLPGNSQKAPAPTYHHGCDGSKHAPRRALQRRESFENGDTAPSVTRVARRASIRRVAAMWSG